MNSSELLNSSGLPLDILLASMELEWRTRRSENRLAEYRPYTKQLAFHAEGLLHRERLLRAGNQVGKTLAGAAEMAYHLTGEYPEWWPGRRFNHPVDAWAGGKDGASLRDSVVKLLCGPKDARGTGLIPKRCIVGDPTASRGVPDSVDNITVQHVSGETSHLTFKTYDQGRERWQSATLHLVWMDEEPDEDIYTEALSRTNATGGFVFITFTPLLGMSAVVRRFLMDASPDRSDTNMTIEDAEHIPPERRQQIIDSYPEHEREARTKGIPILGSGAVFPVADELFAIDPFPIPAHWVLIGGLDFGWDHPTAAVRLAHDRDTDTIYVTHGYKRSRAVPAIHCAALKQWGKHLLWSWPRDGLQHDKGGGEQLAQQYRDNGLRMLANPAEFPGDRGVSVEAGLMEMVERMETQRLRVFRNLTDWFEEKRLYHRKDGIIVKEYDDMLDATRYGLMCIHAAKPAEKAKSGQLPASTTLDYSRRAEAGWMR